MELQKFKFCPIKIFLENQVFLIYFNFMIAEHPKIKK